MEVGAVMQVKIWMKNPPVSTQGLAANRGGTKSTELFLPGRGGGGGGRTVGRNEGRPYKGGSYTVVRYVRFLWIAYNKNDDDALCFI